MTKLKKLNRTTQKLNMRQNFKINQILTKPKIQYLTKLTNSKLDKSKT